MKKNKLARMQKSERNRDEKILLALSGGLPPHPRPEFMRSVLRHGNTITFEEVNP